MPQAQKPKPVFLLGPPGAGKTTLGRQACETLDLNFGSVAEVFDSQSPLTEAGVRQALAPQEADLLEVPWDLHRDSTALKLIRRHGFLLGLWAHPIDMQSRSGREEQLFTPSPRLKTRGGFGRTGSGCREYRTLDKTCHDVLEVVGLSQDQACEALTEWVVDIREREALPAAERAGIERWADYWKSDYPDSPANVDAMVDAMARYLLALETQGVSPRRIREVTNDLNASGLLVLGYEAPYHKHILDCFSHPPAEIEFRHRISDSVGQVTRYLRSMKGFAKFLRESGMIGSDE